MSPELKHAVETLEMKASRSIEQDQRRTLMALRDIGAVQVAEELDELIQHDVQVKAEAKEVASQLRKTIQPR